MFHSNTKKIYLDHGQHDYFSRSYYALDEELTVAASSLLKSYLHPDEYHKSILANFKTDTLILIRDKTLSPGWFYIAGSVH